jgi:hypothetical protein
MINEKPKTAFDLPKINCKELPFERCTNELEELKAAKHSISFYVTPDNKYKCIYTDFDEEEFYMVCNHMNRHIELFNFFKLAVLDAEKMRAIPCEEHDFTYKAIEYIRLKKLNNLNLNIK